MRWTSEAMVLVILCDVFGRLVIMLKRNVPGYEGASQSDMGVSLNYIYDPLTDVQTDTPD